METKNKIYSCLKFIPKKGDEKYEKELKYLKIYLSEDKEIPILEDINTRPCKNNSIENLKDSDSELSKLVTIGLINYIKRERIELTDMLNVIEKLNKYNVFEPKGTIEDTELKKDYNSIISNFIINSIVRCVRNIDIDYEKYKLINELYVINKNYTEKFINKISDEYFRNICEYGVCNNREYIELYDPIIYNIRWVSDNVVSFKCNNKESIYKLKERLSDICKYTKISATNLFIVYYQFSYKDKDVEDFNILKEMINNNSETNSIFSEEKINYISWINDKILELKAYDEDIIIGIGKKIKGLFPNIKIEIIYNSVISEEEPIVKKL